MASIPLQTQFLTINFQLSSLEHMTIFSKIIAGDIPSYKIHETEKTYAFLDIYPFTLGHTLIVPKVEVPSFDELPDDIRNAVFAEAQVLSKAIQKGTGCKRVGLMVHGMGIPDHFHLHLIPLFTNDDMDKVNSHEEPEEEMLRIQAEITKHLQ
jgi:histidine triad (HIT) family protein